MTRREKFREYMARLAAAADPALALQQSLYVHPPGALSDLLVPRLEIDPTSSQLVVGGVGSGKTTQLLIGAQKLSAMGDIAAEYFDVSARQDLAKLQPGCLVALAGTALIHLLKLDNSQDWISFRSWIARYWYYYNIPKQYVESLERGAKLLKESGRDLVLLFDSLDRMTDLEAFTKIVEQDIAALKHAGIGVVLVGPIRSLAGFGRLEVDRFDHLLTHFPPDPQQDPKGRQFLIEVLRKRTGTAALSDEVAGQLVSASAGVLRDLISLAKAAVDQAYVRGGDVIDSSDVASAVDTFGRSLMVGLTPEEVETLKHLRSTGGFVRTSDSDLALMASRRIIQYRGTPARYAPHPTLLHLLDQVAERA